jgi:hypothetical protein
MARDSDLGDRGNADLAGAEPGLVQLRPLELTQGRCTGTGPVDQRLRWHASKAMAASSWRDGRASRGRL